MIEILKNLCQVKGGAVEMKLLSIPVGGQEVITDSDQPINNNIWQL